MRNIDLIREVTTSAAGRWPDVLSLAGITVPGSPRQHSECPACGGTDRFRFDDGGRGSHFCNQCGAGDGLDLVAKVIPSDYGEQVHRVGARFAILEAALVLGTVITGWDAQTCRDAIQHSYNAWVREFGTGNKEHQQIIEQAEAFLTAYGFSRYLPYPEPCERDLPIRDLAGYRTGSQRNEGEKFKFYTFPGAFEGEIASGFNPQQFARVLANAGMLEAGGDRLKKKALKKIGGKQHTFYVLMYSPEDEEGQPE